MSYFLLYIKDEVNFVTNLNCLWCSFSQQSNPTDECEKRQTKCEWYFAHLNEDLMSELSRSPVVLRL